MIDAYFRAILDTLRRSPIVQSHHITFDKRGASAGYVRGDVFFADDSQLHFREFVRTYPVVDRFIYVYHYQDPTGRMVFRYDNSGHYPDLATHPHHKHIAGDAAVVACDPPSLAAVLGEIEGG